MAGGTCGGGLPHRGAVMREKLRVGMAGRSLQLGPAYERAWIRSQGLDHGHLGRIHVTLAAEIPGMTGGACRRYTARAGSGSSLTAVLGSRELRTSM